MMDLEGELKNVEADMAMLRAAQPIFETLVKYPALLAKFVADAQTTATDGSKTLADTAKLAGDVGALTARIAAVEDKTATTAAGVENMAGLIAPMAEAHTTLVGRVDALEHATPRPEPPR